MTDRPTSRPGEWVLAALWILGVFGLLYALVTDSESLFGVVSVGLGVLVALTLFYQYRVYRS